MGLNARLRQIVPTSTLLNIYQSLITPYLTYGLISWGNACKTFLDQTCPSKTRTAFNIFCWQKRPRNTFFCQSKKLRAFTGSILRICFQFYDVNKNTAPDNILKLFSRISRVHPYNTRASTSEHFYTKESRLNVKRNVFRVLGSKFGMGYLKC